MIRFGIRMLAGGAVATAAGLVIFVNALTDAFFPSKVFSGGIWKGPIILVGGIALIVVGVRALKETSNNEQEDSD